MNAKEYLSQAFYLDERINNKIEQIDMLNSLATKATTTLSDMPRSRNESTSKMEDTIIKIITLQEEINKDIIRLVDLKREIIGVINKIKNKEHQTILEKRYLCFLNFEQIAVDMNFSIQHIFRIHNKAIGQIQIPKEESKCDRKRV
ncbi:DUF1492 domain-containing protein [Miniphocaeibacter massiliensis]|uniref:DUF1492 domain-containing protein n=1 Tax=Miniphocaeibacter massiliensis TaxID=2041841 RepID=UPI000C1B9F0E|nr:DUF1492 domain-containing protein [Miniphocaeibacter massiliensis]